MIRTVDTEEEVLQAHRLEMQCYPPEAAATLEAFRFRQRTFPEFFLAAIHGGVPVGIINGVRTDTENLSDEAMKGATAADADGKFFCILTVAVQQSHRRHGIGSALVRALVEQACRRNIKAVLLMCEEHLVPFYEKLGFHYVKPSGSTHGGIAWHEMKLVCPVTSADERRTTPETPAR